MTQSDYADAVKNVLNKPLNPLVSVYIKTIEEVPNTDNAVDIICGLILMLANKHPLKAYKVVVSCAILEGNEKLCSLVLDLWGINSEEADPYRVKFLGIILPNDEKDAIHITTKLRMRFFSVYEKCLIQLVYGDIETLKQLAAMLYYETKKQRYALASEFYELYTFPDKMYCWSKYQIQEFYKKFEIWLYNLIDRCETASQKKCLYFYLCLIIQRKLLLLAQNKNCYFLNSVKPHHMKTLYNYNFGFGEEQQYDTEQIENMAEIGKITQVSREVTDLVEEAIVQGKCFTVQVIFEGGKLPRFDAMFLDRIDALIKEQSDEEKLITDALD